MALASDLMGLGMPGSLALQIAAAGSGGLTISSAGATGTFATATRIAANQTMVACSNADGTKGLGLPVVGSDAGSLLGDVFYITNTNTTDCLKVFSSSGVAICVGGSNTSSCTAGVCGTLILWPVSTTQWVGVKA